MQLAPTHHRRHPARPRLHLHGDRAASAAPGTGPSRSRRRSASRWRSPGRTPRTATATASSRTTSGSPSRSPSRTSATGASTRRRCACARRSPTRRCVDSVATYQRHRTAAVGRLRAGDVLALHRRRQAAHQPVPHRDPGQLRPRHPRTRSPWRRRRRRRCRRPTRRWARTPSPCAGRRSRIADLRGYHVYRVAVRGRPLPAGQHRPARGRRPTSRTSGCSS